MHVVIVRRMRELDRLGRVTLEMYEPSYILQGELIERLMRLARDRYLVLSRSEIAELFRESPRRPEELKSGDPAGTAAVLRLG